MAESKYEKYVTRKAEMLLGHDPDGKVNFGIPETYKVTDTSIATTGPRMIFSNDHVTEGTSKVEYGWVLKDMVLLGSKENNYGAHKHDYAEIFIFYGNDPYDTAYLGGEGEFWLGEGDDTEKIMFNESVSVFVPAGLGHFPCFFKNVKTPINMIVVVPTVGDLRIVPIER